MNELSRRDLIELHKLYGQYGAILARLFEMTMRECDAAIRVQDDAFKTAMLVAKRDGVREAFGRILKTLANNDV